MIGFGQYSRYFWLDQKYFGIIINNHKIIDLSLGMDIIGPYYSLTMTFNA
jgi:hypothetical protein